MILNTVTSSVKNPEPELDYVDLFHQFWDALAFLLYHSYTLDTKTWAQYYKPRKYLSLKYIMNILNSTWYTVLMISRQKEYVQSNTIVTFWLSMIINTISKAIPPYPEYILKSKFQTRFVHKSQQVHTILLIWF